MRYCIEYNIEIMNYVINIICFKRRIAKTFYFCKNISTIRYTGTKEDFEALHMDVSCFLSTTMTDDVICAGGQKAKLPELQGQLELPKEYQ